MKIKSTDEMTNAELRREVKELHDAHDPNAGYIEGLIDDVIFLRKMIVGLADDAMQGLSSDSNVRRFSRNKIRDWLTINKGLIQSWKVSD